MAPRFLYWRLIGLTSPCLLVFPWPISTCSSSIFWYLAFLAIDWSRTVSASSFLGYITLACPLTLLIPSLPFADFCLGRDHFGSASSWPLFLLVFLCTLVGGASSSFRVFGPCSFASPVVSVLSLFCLFSPPSPCPPPALRSPWVLCLVFLAVDWSRISSATLTSPLFCLLRCSPSAPLPSRYFFAKSVPVWYFWPQTGQGYHSAGSPQSFQSGTVSGRRLVQGLLLSIPIHGTSY